MNFSKVRGQQHAIRAIEVALTGGHNLLLVGEAGGGKTTLLNAIEELDVASTCCDNKRSSQLFLDSNAPVIMTTRPCQCGWYFSDEKECTCPVKLIRIHLERFYKIQYSVDMFIELSPLSFEQITDDRPGESSTVIETRIAEARERIADVHTLPNQAAISLLKAAHAQLQLSAGMIFRTINVARTITAMANETTIGPPHLAEAIQYRSHFPVEG